MKDEQKKKDGLFSKILFPKNSDKDTLQGEDVASDDIIAEEKEDDLSKSVPEATFADTKKADEESWHRIPAGIAWAGKSRLTIEVNKDSTKARVSIAMPPDDEIETFSAEILQEALSRCNIVFGLIKEAIDSIFIDPPSVLLYNTPVLVAVGVEPVSGIDGQVKELFERVNKIHFDERPDGSIDFKNLHIVNNVEAGTVICEITDPIQGIAGTSIYGKPIRPTPAKAPAVPRGENVELVDIDEMHAQLVASIDGNLIFKNDRFCVESTFNVKGNVDNGVGDIEFSGNVMVYGDVFEGYTIKTGHDVTVNGIVEGASIYADGQICLKKGMNGMGKGILEAKGDITAKFLENCTVRAGGNIKAESIVNCTIEADGNITLTGRGTLVGGTVTAYGSIDVKILGSRSNTPLEVILGVTPHMLRERNSLRQQYKAVIAQYQSLTRDIIFLQQHSGSPEYEKKLDQYRGKLNLATFKKNRLEKRIQELVDEETAATPAALTCITAYPPLRITIGTESLRISDIGNMCRFYQSQSGEVVMGKK